MDKEMVGDSYLYAETYVFIYTRHTYIENQQDVSTLWDSHVLIFFYIRPEQGILKYYYITKCNCIHSWQLHQFDWFNQDHVNTHSDDWRSNVCQHNNIEFQIAEGEDGRQRLLMFCGWKKDPINGFQAESPYSLVQPYIFSATNHYRSVQISFSLNQSYQA